MYEISHGFHCTYAYCFRWFYLKLFFVFHYKLLFDTLNPKHSQVIWFFVGYTLLHKCKIKILHDLWDTVCFDFVYNLFSLTSLYNYRCLTTYKMCYWKAKLLNWSLQHLSLSSWSIRIVRLQLKTLVTPHFWLLWELLFLFFLLNL